MAESPVTQQPRGVAGQTLIHALEESGVECHAAFWALMPTDRSWRLYLVTPSFDTDGPRQLLRKASQILHRLNGHAKFDLFDLEFESPASPTILQIASTFEIAHGSFGRITNFTINGLHIEEIHPYFILSDKILSRGTKGTLPNG